MQDRGRNSNGARDPSSDSNTKRSWGPSVPTASPSKSSSASTWRSPSESSNSSSGMKVLKEGTAPPPPAAQQQQQPSNGVATTPPTSWAALLGGSVTSPTAMTNSGGGKERASKRKPRASKKNPKSAAATPAAEVVVVEEHKKEEVSSPSSIAPPPIRLAPWAKKPVVIEEKEEKEAAVVEEVTKPSLTTANGTPLTAAAAATAMSPRSFSFQRGNGVVIVQEAPSIVSSSTTTTPRKRPSESAEVAIESPTKEEEKEEVEEVVVVSPSPPPVMLSWAEKAKLAAGKAAPSPQKHTTRPVVAPTSPSSISSYANSKRGGNTGPRPASSSRSSAAVAPAKPSNSTHQQPPPVQQQQQQRQRERRNNSNGNRDNTRTRGKEETLAAAVDRKASPVLKEALPSPQQTTREIVTTSSSIPSVVVAPQQPVAATEQPPQPAAAVKNKASDNITQLCKFLSSFRLNGGTTASTEQQENGVTASPLRVLPRGINNPGNLCFVNAVLQALMGSTSFCAFFIALQSAGSDLDKAEYPVLSAMAAIAKEFEKKPVVTSVSDEGGDGEGDDEGAATTTTTTTKTKASSSADTMVLGGHPVSSTLVLELIRQFSPRQQQNKGEEGQVEQEDAHEFLHFLLDRMHSELLKLSKQQQQQNGSAAAAEVSPPSSPAAAAHKHGEEGEQEEDHGWLVKSGKRAVKQQEVSAAPSEEASVITALFQGKLATSVACAGTPVSVTVHPFTLIEVPILSDAIRSIDDALDALTASEILEDYKPSAGAAPQQAAKTERFLHLPEILVLHLMRFQYIGKSAKVNKFVAFEPRLSIRSSWLATGSSDRGAVYDLVATVSHHGKSLTSGHYTADVLQAGGKWLRFDDSDAYWMPEQKFLAERPYLLVYQRSSSTSVSSSSRR